MWETTSPRMPFGLGQWLRTLRVRGIFFLGSVTGGGVAQAPQPPANGYKPSGFGDCGDAEFRFLVGTIRVIHPSQPALSFGVWDQVPGADDRGGVAPTPINYWRERTNFGRVNLPGGSAGASPSLAEAFSSLARRACE